VYKVEITVWTFSTTDGEDGVSKTFVPKRIFGRNNEHNIARFLGRTTLFNANIFEKIFCLFCVI